MCIQIPFKEKCVAFWSLDNTLKNEIDGRARMFVEKGKLNFSLTERGFKYTKFNNVLKVTPEGIEGRSVSLVFQTKKLEMENDDRPNCSLFSFVKDGETKLCLEFEQCDDCLSINIMKKPMKDKIDTFVPINTLTQDRWITHVMIYDYECKQIKYYINATLACIIDVSGDVNMRLSDLYFNREYPCNGYIRNIGVYDCALSYEQIIKLVYHNYYKKISVNLWLKFIEFLYKDKKELIPWI